MNRFEMSAKDVLVTQANLDRICCNSKVVPFATIAYLYAKDQRIVWAISCLAGAERWQFDGIAVDRGAFGHVNSQADMKCGTGADVLHSTENLSSEIIRRTG